MTHEFYFNKKDAIANGRPGIGYVVNYLVSKKTMQQKTESFNTFNDAIKFSKTITKKMKSGLIFIYETKVYGNINYGKIVEVV